MKSWWYLFSIIIIFITFTRIIFWDFLDILMDFVIIILTNPLLFISEFYTLSVNTWRHKTFCYILSFIKFIYEFTKILYFLVKNSCILLIIPISRAGTSTTFSRNFSFLSNFWNTGYYVCDNRNFWRLEGAGWILPDVWRFSKAARQSLLPD